jgi:hypothetical protein
VNLSRQFKFYWNLAGIRVFGMSAIYKFIIIFRCIIRRMKNISDESCSENRDTHFMFSNSFPNIVHFMR